MKSSTCTLTESLSDCINFDPHGLDPSIYQRKSWSLNARRLRSALHIEGQEEQIVRFFIPDCIEKCSVLLIGDAAPLDVLYSAVSTGRCGKVVVACTSLCAVNKLQEEYFAITDYIDNETSSVDFICMTDDGKFSCNDESFDVVLLSPFINFVLDKQNLICEALRVLKEGGELSVASLFASRRLSNELKCVDILCESLIAGAEYIEDFRRMIASFGIRCFRYMDQHDIDISPLLTLLNEDAQRELNMTSFSYRAIKIFKLFDFEDLCEKYGQVLTYKGNAPGCEQYLDVNDTHRFFTGQPLGVCGNTCSMVQNTRFAQYFEIEGNRDFHQGTYDYCLYCGTQIGENGRLSDMARHLTQLDLERKQSSNNKDVQCSCACEVCHMRM